MFRIEVSSTSDDAEMYLDVVIALSGECIDRIRTLSALCRDNNLLRVHSYTHITVEIASTGIASTGIVIPAATITVLDDIFYIAFEHEAEWFETECVNINELGELK